MDSFFDDLTQPLIDICSDTEKEYINDGLEDGIAFVSSLRNTFPFFIHFSFIKFTLNLFDMYIIIM